MTSELRAGSTSDEFDRAARRYDLMVALNPGYHAELRRAARVLAAGLPTDRSVRLLDLGCGSGASTRALLSVSGADTSRVDELVGMDASDGMLAQARVKSWPAGVRFVHGRAEDLAGSGVQELDGVLAAYLFRNVAPDNRDAAVRMVFDALRPGGTLVVQEYSVAGRWPAQAVWTAVCWGVVVPLAAVTSRRTALYRYLWRSVLDFDPVDRFCSRLAAAGFTDVRVHAAGSWQRGILHTFSARRPA